jgi:hypothetical protein
VFEKASNWAERLGNGETLERSGVADLDGVGVTCVGTLRVFKRRGSDSHLLFHSPKIDEHPCS